MKVLVTGAAGFLGTKIMKVLKNDFELIGTDRNGRKSNLKMDITEMDNVKEVFEDSKPDVVIHTAAMSDVDKCQREPENADKVNIKGAHNVASACKENNIKMVYISTDFIFDGEKGDYKEEDAPNPLSYYAKTKLMGEKKVLDSGVDFLIIRPEVLYGFNGDGSERSFAFWAYENLKQGKEIRIVDDQFNTPTLVDDIADAIKKLIKNKRRGVYHVAGPERVSRYDMALKIAEVFGFDSSLVKPIKSSELKQNAPRPKDSSLNTEKLKKEGIIMHNLEQGLKIMKKQMGC